MIDYTQLAFQVESMQLSDIVQVIAIEHVSFSAPWSAAAYEREILYNDNARFFVVRSHVQPVPQPTSPARGWFRYLRKPGNGAAEHSSDPGIVGYGGFWLMAGEAHIMTIAIKPEFRGKHIGELLLAAMIDRAGEMGASQVTLEVRVTNIVAQNLYRKYAFTEVGKRVRYYSDNNEDALIMTTSPLRSESYQRLFQTLKQSLAQRLSRQERA